jgi:radical SAM superfamily enzyme YgiQ (UPF0313 family)
MKIMFILPKTIERAYIVTYSRPGFPHTGVAYLVSLLKQNNIAVKIMDMRLDHTIDELFSCIDEFNPDLIGITSYSFQYTKAYELIDKIKLHGNHTIVIGGPHISAIKGQGLAETKADFAIKQEGEYTLLELCKAIEAKTENYENIKGLIWRNGENAVENADRPYIQNLDALPFPAYEEFELEKYSNVLPIITSRGCPYQCIFCSVRISMGNRFRARSPKNIVDEIEHWYNKGWRKFDFNDDCFTFDMKRATEICDLILKKGLSIQYKLYNGIRVDRVSKDLLQRMKKSGCTFVQYGIESGNDEVLRTIKKGITVELARKTIKITNDVGIPNAANFIIGHPGETFDKALDSVRLAETLPTKVTPFYNLIPYPGSELFQWIEKNATFLRPPEVYLNEISYGELEPVFETREFSVKERKKVLKIGFSLYRKKILEYKLGKVLGYLAYLISKSDTLWKIGVKVLMETKIGSRIPAWIIRRQ